MEIPNEFLSIPLLCRLPESFENFKIASETKDTLPNIEMLNIKILEECYHMAQYHAHANVSAW